MTRKSTHGKSCPVRSFDMDRDTVIAPHDFNALLPVNLRAILLRESETPRAKSPKKPARSQRRKSALENRADHSSSFSDFSPLFLCAAVLGLLTQIFRAAISAPTFVPAVPDRE